MNRLSRALPLVAALMMPVAALAHPDHPHTLGFADSFAHLFGSPDHLLLLLLPVVAAIVFGKKILHWLRDRQGR